MGRKCLASHNYVFTSELQSAHTGALAPGLSNNQRCGSHGVREHTACARVFCSHRASPRNAPQLHTLVSVTVRLRKSAFSGACHDSLIHGHQTRLQRHQPPAAPLPCRQGPPHASLREETRPALPSGEHSDRGGHGEETDVPSTPRVARSPRRQTRVTAATASDRTPCRRKADPLTLGIAGGEDSGAVSSGQQGRVKGDG